MTVNVNQQKAVAQMLLQQVNVEMLQMYTSDEECVC